MSYTEESEIAGLRGRVEVLEDLVQKLIVFAIDSNNTFDDLGCNDVLCPNVRNDFNEQLNEE